MAGKISELAALTGAAAATTDLIETVDISDTSMAATGTNKKMTLAEMIVFVNANGGGSRIVSQPSAPTDTTVLWADTDEVGIEENVRYLSNVTGTTYTLVLADRGKLLLCSNAAAQTVTVPTNATAAFAIGTQLDLVQTGVGVLTIAAAGGVTINATPSLAFRARYSGASLIKTATDTWLLLGDLAV